LFLFLESTVVRKLTARERSIQLPPFLERGDCAAVALIYTVRQEWPGPYYCIV
jgi:hypothetical protein